MQDFLGSLSPEEIVPRQHLVENAAQTEHIRCADLPFLLAGQICYLRRKEAWRSAAKVEVG